MVLGGPRKENMNFISYKYLFHRVESLTKPVKQSISSSKFEFLGVSIETVFYFPTLAPFWIMYFRATAKLASHMSSIAQYR